MNIVVYMAVFGNYDKIRPPYVIDKDVRYVLFADTPCEVPPWETIVVDVPFGNRKTNRYYKLNSHLLFPAADVTIYHDGTVSLIKSAHAAAEYVAGHDIALERHTDRKCAYQEAVACYRGGFSDEGKTKEQVAAYRNDGFPENFGLAGCHFLIRRNTESARVLNEMWWGELQKHTVRDQISFPYCAWKLKTDITWLPKINQHGLYKQTGHGK